MQLPNSMREALVDELDEYLEAFSAEPDSEAVAAFVVELLESFAEDESIDDVIHRLEESGELEGALAETLESEMSSNDEFEYTGEEVVSLLERLTGIEWSANEEADDETKEEADDDPEEVEPGPA